MQFIINFLDNFQHKKPLLWSILKGTQRFAFVGNSKLEHIVLNPEEDETVDPISDAFQIQDMQVEKGVCLKILVLRCLILQSFVSKILNQLNNSLELFCK